MNYQDKDCVCNVCEQTFSISASIQQQFAEEEKTLPTRCPECRLKRSLRRKNSRKANGVTHTVTCAQCNTEAQVPFVPNNTKPILCDACFKSRIPKAKAEPKPFELRKSEKPQVDETATALPFAEFNFDERIQRAIIEAGYESPTPVQSATIPAALECRDLIGTAQTGTGKTAAFVLPILQNLIDNPSERRGTRAIVLTPTRELAEQIHQTFRQLGRYTKIKSATVYGGVGMRPQENALRSGVEVIIACPGRLLDHMDRGNTNFSQVSKLVLDEADRMLDMGFLPQIKDVLEKLPAERHSMLFSATFAPELNQLAKNTLKNPQRIEVDICAPPKTIAHTLYPCPAHLKTTLLLEMLDKTDSNSILIFTRTKHRANRLAEQIQKAGYGSEALHSNKSQNQRQIALDNFRLGRCKILVATDIAARGLDVATISHVMNYDIPDTADTYIHRIGRTGRMEREGDAITLVTPSDTGVVRDIERALGSSIERRKLDDFDYTMAAPPGDEIKGDYPPQRESRARQAQEQASSRSRAHGSVKIKPTFAPGNYSKRHGGRRTNG